MIGPFKWFSKTPFVWSFPIRQEILNVSQIGKAFHRICPPFFIQTWLQQYCRRTFFHSAFWSLSNPICLRSVWCRRTKIPGKIFTGFAKFQGVVSVMTSGFLSGSKNFCKLLSVSWEVFVSHGHDWIHWVAKSCTTTAYRWLFEIHNLHWELCDLL